MKTPNKILIHHSASPIEWTTHRDVNRWHKKRGYGVSSEGFNIAYHYFIESDGEVIKARSDWERTKHTKIEDVNNESIAICLAGNFEVDKPTEAQRDALSDLIYEKASEYGIKHNNVLRHRDVQSTKCPGKNLNIEPYKNKLKRDEEKRNGIKNLLKLIHRFLKYL